MEKDSMLILIICRLWNSAPDKPMGLKPLVQAALNCGAANAALISGGQVVCCESFRDICRANQCGLYGKCWVCPPEIGEIQTLISRVKAYPQGLLYQTIGTLEDSFDIEGMGEAKRKHIRMSYQLEERVKPLLWSAEICRPYCPDF